MKVALGMILKNEEKMLERHLSLISPCFAGAVFLDDGSTDKSLETIDNYCRCNFDIIQNNDGFIGFDEKRNRVIKKAEELGYDAIFMLDADECMFQKDIDKVIEMLETNETIALPRYEFTIDFKHYTRHIYPDYQLRVFHLNKGYHYRNKLHEIVYQNSNEKAVSEIGELKYADKFHIFHYGRCKDRNFLWSKDNDYNRILQGLEPANEQAPDISNEKDIFVENSILFEGEQPV